MTVLTDISVSIETDMILSAYWTEARIELLIGLKEDRHRGE